MSPTLSRCFWTSALALFFLAGPSSILDAQTCQGNTPAFPVPGAYWPTDLSPGDPGVVFPTRRDSTSWQSLSVPGWQSGHELFVGVATVPGVLFAAYNAGFHVWNIGAGHEELTSELDDLITYRDGWLGDFLSFPDFSEVDLYGNYIAAYQDGSNAFAGYSALGAAGFSLFKLNTTPPITGSDLTQLYQDTGVSAYEVKFEKIGATLYAFVAVLGGPDGIFVYDVSRAQALGSCLDNAAHTACPGVFLGQLGATSNGKYVDVLPLANGHLMVSASRGNTGGVILMEVTSIGNVTQRFSGLASRSHGTALFEKGNTTYLAAVEQELPGGGHVRIYDIDNCIGSNCSLGAPVWQSRPFAFRGVAQTLTYSESGGTPFLHYGIRSNTMSGANEDFLLDLTNLGGTNVLRYVGEDGATFPDTCSGEDVGYWGWYYPGNDDGHSEFSPIQGTFQGQYFYRANWTSLDVHVYGEVTQDPTIDIAATTASPHWMDEPIDFDATLANCPGGGTWDWQHTDTLPATVLNQGSSSQITFSLCANDDCPDRAVDVSAGFTACPSATVTPASITLEEPRAQIRSLDVSPPANPATYPVCTLLSFSATVDGFDDFQYDWRIKDATTGQEMQNGTAAVLPWDTSNVVIELPPEIFADGFESGDVTGWSAIGEGGNVTAASYPAGPSDFASRLLEKLYEGVLASRDFVAELTVTNRSGAWTTPTQQLPFTLTALGPLGLGNPPITATDLGGGLYEFTAQSSNATQWRWEFQDPENGTEACTLFTGMCQVLDWSPDNSTVPFHWEPPNAPGTFRVGVEIDNCSNDPTVGDFIDHIVTEVVIPEPLAMTSFEVHADSINIGGDTSRPCKWNPLFATLSCKRSTAIQFEAIATGNPSSFGFDWEGDSTFEQTIPAANTILHTYSSNGVRAPQARAQLGASTSDPVDITFSGSPITFEIVDTF